MEVLVTKSFNKDLARLKDPKIARKVEDLISNLQKCKTLHEIASLKKIEGASNAYRVRIGDFRIGFFLQQGVVILTVFANRKDIYKLFP
ncbi:MAG: type II toxin-antitoxin system RelE/ParE family toxin [Bacteroidetes bacterium]|nr:type II toxin-antitoxin system RelE/ParE family toxin [Bacteroidota bacterium]